MHPFRTIILFLIGLQSTALFAQFENLSFERVSVNYGLPNGYIKHIIEDRFGFLWFGTREGLYRYDGYEFKAFRHNFADSTTLAHPNVNDILEDREGNIWIATSNGLSLLNRRLGNFDRYVPYPRSEAKTKSYNLIRRVFEDQQGRLWLASRVNMLLFDRDDKSFRIYNQAGAPEKRHFVRSYFEDTNGNLWAGTTTGLLKLPPKDTAFQHIHLTDDPKHPYNKYIVKIIGDASGALWLATRGGLIRWNPETQKIEDDFLPDSLEDKQINYLTLDQNGNPWVALNRNGLGVYDLQHNEFHHFKSQSNQNNSLNNNTVTRLLEDQFKNIWVGTENGISKIRMDHSGFELIQNQRGDGNINNNIFRLLQDRKGRIWSKTPEGYFLKESGQTVSQRIQGLPGEVQGISWDWFLEDHDGGIWLSFSRKGIFRLAPNDQSFQKLPLGDSINNAGILRMLNDPKNKEIVWLGTTLGLCKLNRKNFKRTWYYPRKDIPEVASNQVAVFDQYGDHEIWLYYTYSGSMGKFDKLSGKFELVSDKQEANIALEGDVKDMAIGKDGNIWITTLYGLTNFNIHEKKFRILGKKEGLLEHELQSVLIDQKDKVWVSGNRFFAQYDLTRDTFINYNPPKDIWHFQSKSRYAAEDGSILLGSINGIYAFHPDRIKVNQTAPKVVLTNFKVKAEDFLLDQAYEDTRQITLSYQENDIAFEFSGIHYLEPSTNQYKCRLINFDEDWRSLGNEHKISYTNLNPGNYTFQAIASNSDGVWNEKGLTIQLAILPAFWQTFWFKLLILLLVVAIGYALYKNSQHQMALKRQKELALKSAEYKTQFLAEVSHEIRTPMNAIIGLSKLILDTPLEPKQFKFINAIQQSSKNLLNIINDLLDHTKLEAGKFTFVEKKFSIAELVSQLQDTFEPQTKKQQLALRINLQPDVDQQIQGDPIRLNQILTNLLGNAIKFTKEGEIWLTINTVSETEQNINFNFEVGDTGIGIAQDQLESIFESYSQANNSNEEKAKGTGLGLAIAKQLVEKQGGQLSIESKVNQGTRLWFSLTYKKASPLQQPGFQVRPTAQLEHLKILLVEDTYFNQLLVIEILKKYIQEVKIEVAENGKVALEKLQNEKFDLILMDVKMPVMDGYEASRIIRNNPKIQQSDIPILAVTASALPEQLEKCRKAGMNDFITKPIDEHKLIEKIQALTKKQKP